MSNKKDRIADSITNNDTEEQKNQSPIAENQEDKEIETPNNDEVEISNAEGNSKEDDIEKDSDTVDKEIENQDVENDLEETDNADEPEKEETDAEEYEVSYVVIHPFRDLEDKTSEYPNGYIYHVNDSYPHAGFLADEKRIQELASFKNKIGKVLIEIKK